MNGNSQKLTPRRINWLNVIGVFILATPIFYCVVFPLITVNLTGQICFGTGNVPLQAEERYFELLFTAAQEENYEWLETVLDRRIVNEIHNLQPHISSDYQMTWGDHLYQAHWRTLQFEDGTKVSVTFSGNFDCPDFNITDEEILNNIKLVEFD